MSNAWETIIGLEVHAQVSMDAKLFSGAQNAMSDANEHVSLIDTAMPGMLPTLNEVAVRQAIRTGLALDATINTLSRFDRKHYFYADLPQGYQISQYHQPIVGNGRLSFIDEEGGEKTIRITRIHLEQDAGKSIHDAHPHHSLIDLNRAGVALMEIVFEPDLTSAQDAGSAIHALRTLLRAIGTCDGNMEEGNLRADVNVSVRKKGAPLGTRTEIKNLNSIRFIQQAITYEAQRQIEELEEGKDIIQQTRLFNSKTGETHAMRSKEEAHDYRYFPDPDLPPLTLDEKEIIRLKNELPELPQAMRKRFMSDYKLKPADASLLTEDKDVAHYFEEVAQHHDPQDVAPWVLGELFAFLKKEHLAITQNPVSPAKLSDLLSKIKDGTLSTRLAKDVFHELTRSHDSVDDIINKKGLAQISDDETLTLEIQKILEKNRDKVTQYQEGKDKLFGFFVGQVMQATQGQANPQKVNALLKEALAKKA